jgi:hypothetical protein
VLEEVAGVRGRGVELSGVQGTGAAVHQRSSDLVVLVRTPMRAVWEISAGAPSERSNHARASL